MPSFDDGDEYSRNNSINSVAQLWNTPLHDARQELKQPLPRKNRFQVNMVQRPGLLDPIKLPQTKNHESVAESSNQEIQEATAVPAKVKAKRRNFNKKNVDSKWSARALTDPFGTIKMIERRASQEIVALRKRTTPDLTPLGSSKGEGNAGPSILSAFEDLGTDENGSSTARIRTPSPNKIRAMQKTPEMSFKMREPLAFQKLPTAERSVRTPEVPARNMRTPRTHTLESLDAAPAIPAITPRVLPISLSNDDTTNQAERNSTPRTPPRDFIRKPNAFSRPKSSSRSDPSMDSARTDEQRSSRSKTPNDNQDDYYERTPPSSSRSNRGEFDPLPALSRVPHKMNPMRPTGKPNTVSALRDIQRNREARRAEQAKEKKRKNKEKREHGHDENYKYRVLVRKYRDKLRKYQETHPPNTQINTNVSQRLNVYVRKRPMNEKEKNANGYDIVTCSEATKLICHEPKVKVDCSPGLEHYPFAFDGIFHEKVDNPAVYEHMVQPFLSELSTKGTLTVFAYGQTGSGKTYTMKSVYRYAANDLFNVMKEVKGAKKLKAGFSFYEIYMGKVFDLLNHRNPVQVLEDNEAEVQIVGLKEFHVEHADHLLDLIERGEEARATSKNAIHSDSSRSHAIARITLFDEHKDRFARLSMVDLAGSERAGDTQTDDKQTRMEGAEINKSLLALKECIRALDMEAGHIPFRGSKLTQILRDSFIGENSKMVMLATISPSSQCSNYTMNTLRYADRLKELSYR